MAGILDNIRRGVSDGLKAVLFYPSDTPDRPRLYTGTLPGFGGRPINWERDAGDPWRNVTVASCLRWIGDNFPEAPLGVKTIDTADDDIDHNHPLAKLIRRPNAYISRSTLWSATMLSYLVDGNAYWIKVRNGANMPVELWYRPHFMMRPVGFDRPRPGDPPLSHYVYKVGDDEYRLEPQDVVHFRDGIDPDNELKGLSRLKALLRSVVTDNQCAAFSAAILRNLGVPGPLIMPNGTVGTPAMNEAQAERFKANFRDRTSGDNAGMPLILHGDYHVVFPDLKLDGAALTAIKKITQTDIAAAIGVPAVVVGLMAGLEMSTAKASHEDARRQAYESCLIPLQRSVAEDIDLGLLGDLGDPETQMAAFDYNNVAVLQEDEDAKHRRIREDFRAGLIDRATAKTALGYDTTPEDDGAYYQAGNVSGGDGTGRDADGDGLTNDRQAQADMNPADRAGYTTTRNGNGNGALAR